MKSTFESPFETEGLQVGIAKIKLFQGDLYRLLFIAGEIQSSGADPSRQQWDLLIPDDEIEPMERLDRHLIWMNSETQRCITLCRLRLWRRQFQQGKKDCDGVTWRTCEPSKATADFSMRAEPSSGVAAVHGPSKASVKMRRSPGRGGGMSVKGSSKRTNRTIPGHMTLMP